VNTQTLTLDGATLTRVGYTDVTIPREFLGLGADDFARAPWRSPLWTDGENVRIGAAVWFADVAGKRIAFDPFQAADSVLRADRAAEEAHQAAIARVLAETGFERESVDLGVVGTYADHEHIVPGVSADVRGAHGPGHALLHFGTGAAPLATFLGHLAVSPLHLISGECSALQEDPPAAWSLLQRTVEDARLLIGPLWPTPGFGRWENGAFVAGGPRADHG